MTIDDKIERLLKDLSEEELKRLAERIQSAHASWVIAEKVTGGHIENKLLRALMDVRDRVSR